MKKINSLFYLLFLIGIIQIIACNPKKSGDSNAQKVAPTPEAAPVTLDLKKRASLKKLENFEYDNLNGLDVLNLEHLLTDKVINATEPNNNQIRPGSIIIYKSSKRLVGKLQILEYKANLRFKATTYLREGTKVYQVVDAITITPGASFDLEEIIMTIKDRDFSWDSLPGNVWQITPKNRAKYYVQTKH